MKVRFYTLGCKVNQYETQILRQAFAAAGYELSEDAAQVLVINSCTVTAQADRKARQLLHRLRRENPQAVIALCGCLPQASPAAARALGEADVVAGVTQRAQLPALVGEYLAGGQRVVAVGPHPAGEAFEPMQAQGFLDRKRAFVKIQDGCRRFCAYCIIPTARGPLRSKPLAQLRREVEGLCAAGYQEFVLVGINLALFGQGEGADLADAVQAVSAHPGVRRVRLGSVEPDLVPDGVWQRLSRCEKLCPSFHLPLQSGCDATLRRMNRQYTTAQYARLAGRVRSLFEGCSLSTDVIVGFPGESGQEFEESCRFVQQMGFMKVHVFPFSPRGQTAAAQMPGQLCHGEKEARAARLAALCEEPRQAYLAAQAGRRVQVLFESSAGGLATGYSEAYFPVTVPGGPQLIRRLHPVEVTGISPDGQGCTGQLLSNGGPAAQAASGQREGTGCPGGAGQEEKECLR